MSPEDIDLIKRMVIGGTAVSSAIRMVQEMDEETDNIEDVEELATDKLESSMDSEAVLKLKNRIKAQDNQISNLKSRNESLEDRIKDYEIEVTKLQEKIDKLHYEYTQDVLLK